MSSALLHSSLRLLALTLLLSGLVAWGAADRMSGQTDRYFQATAAEECLTVTARADDRTSDDPVVAPLYQRPPRFLSTGLHTARIDFHPSGASLLSDPGLPRAPPA